MGLENVDCRCCGCALHQMDVRQLALYYHNEDPSMVAVQYVCPRCGTPSWRHFDPADLTLSSEHEGDWLALAEELGLAVLPAGQRPPSDGQPAPALGEFDLSRPIATDETIEFARRIAGLSAEDLRELADSVI